MAQGFAGEGHTLIFPIEYNREAKDANFTAAKDTIYEVDHSVAATQVVITLPVTPTAGDEFLVVGGNNTGGFRLLESGSADPIRFLDVESAGTGSGYWETTLAAQSARVRFYDGAWHIVAHVGVFRSDSAEERPIVGDATGAFLLMGG